MHFELLKRIKPDHYLQFDQIGYIISADNQLLKQININKNKLSFNLKPTEFFSQFNTKTKKEYSQKFLTDLSVFTTDQTKLHALVLLNVNSGYALFIIKKLFKNNEVRLELYNLIKLSHLVKDLFFHDLWDKFKQVIRNNVKNHHLYLAHESLLSFFLLTNLDLGNFKANIKYKEFGETLFYFNPYSKGDVSSTSGVNIIKDGIKKSKLRLEKSLHHMTEKDLIISNGLIINVFVNLE